MRKDCQTLFREIEALRQQMVASAELLGLGHPIVISYSQQLDAMYTKSMRYQVAHK